MLNQIYTMLLLLMAVALVIGLAYLTTLLIAKKSNTILHSRSIKVLERSGVGLNMNITVVQIANKVYLLVIQNKNVTLLDVISLDEWLQTRGTAMTKDMIGKELFKKDIAVTKEIKKLLTKPILKKGEDHNTDGNN